MSSQKRKFSWLDLFIEPEERERRRKENEEKAEKNCCYFNAYN